MHAIICEDPSNNLNVGTVVQGSNEISQLQRKKIALLPYDPELPQAANVGYIQRNYGEGWAFTRNAGERGCPQMLHITDECKYIYWAARVEPKVVSESISLTLRLVHSADNQRGMGRGMSQVIYVAETPVLDERGGATVFGKSEFDVKTDGLLFVELYAVARNVLVKWAALTQHRGDFRCPIG